MFNINRITIFSSCVFHFYFERSAKMKITTVFVIGAMMIIAIMIMHDMSIITSEHIRRGKVVTKELHRYIHFLCHHMQVLHLLLFSFPPRIFEPVKKKKKKNSQQMCF